LDDDEPIDVTGSPPPAKKAKTSSYFGSSKPAETQPPSTAGPSRKPSTSRAASAAPTHLQSYRLPRASIPSSSQTGSAFDAFSYPAPENFPRPSQERTPAQQAKHEAWHRKVVGGTLISRRRSLALDEAAAAEARRQLGIDGDEDADTPIIQDVEGENSEDERQKAAEKVGDTLAAKYGAKADTKGKGKAVSRKKKVEEVGPSGQTYTPLEKQYMEHKARNPDVLLMMEGELLRSFVSDICW
jgi:DNA mismatch repair protein MSH3